MLYISLRQYEYVTVVAETQSLTDAAKRLNVSQPSLSVAISRVEEVLGQKLFARGKGVKLEVTPFGHRIVAKARGLLEEAQGLEREGAAQRPFVLGCFQDIAPWYLAPALERLEAHWPDRQIDNREGRFSVLAEGLAQGEIDLALTYDVGLKGAFEQRVVQQIAPVAFLAVDHPLAAQADVTLEALSAHPLILFTEDESHGFMQGVFDRFRLAPQVAARAASLELMRSLAAHGRGIGISYSQPPGQQSYDGKPLVTRPITDPQARADVVLMWSRHRDDEASLRDAIEVLAQGIAATSKG